MKALALQISALIYIIWNNMDSDCGFKFVQDNYDDNDVVINSQSICLHFLQDLKTA